MDLADMLQLMDMPPWDSTKVMQQWDNTKVVQQWDSTLVVPMHRYHTHI